MKALTARAAAVLACAPIVGQAAEVLPDAQTIRDRSEAAAGAEPLAFREEIDYTGTLSGKRFIFKRGPDRRETDDTGPVHTEFGTNGGKDWHEDPNGRVVIDEPDPGRAAKEKLTTTVARVHEPADAYLISELNVRGFGVRDYYDPVTWDHISRVQLTPNGKIVTTYDDFRPFGSRRLAAHWTTRNETADTRTEYVTRSYVAGDVGDDDVAIPQMNAPFVNFPPGVTSVVIPSVFEPSGHVVVRLTINGRGIDLLLDTGSSTMTLDPGVAHQLGLSTINPTASSGNAGRIATGYAIVPAMSVGSLQMHDAVVTIAPWAYNEPGVETMGLLGFDFLCESAFILDYEHQRVTAVRYGSYSAPQGPGVIALPVRLRSQIPLIDVSINGAIAERMLIDTGAVGTFMLFDYFARRNLDALPRARGAEVPFIGMGGEFDTQTVEIPDLVLGNVDFKNTTGFRVTSPSSYTHDLDGTIGPMFLRLFDVELDYPDGMIYLVPNGSGRRAMRPTATPSPKQ